MQNEKKELFITEISLEDFLKLNLVVYEHRRHFYKAEKEIEYKDTGEWVTDSHGNKHWVSYSDCFSRINWDKVNLNDIVLENIEFARKQGWDKPICVALHSEDGEDLFENSYLDKWLTREGNQTYLLRCDVKHLYSRRNYFYTIDDYFEIDKRETKAVYLIHWN